MSESPSAAGPDQQGSRNAHTRCNRPAERNVNFDGDTSAFRTTDRIIGDSGDTNQFWFGTDGSRCAGRTGALAWSFASGGPLVVTIGGAVVMV